MPDWDYRKTWYHGSPSKLNTIRKGTTITQERELAKAFSHKPTIVSVSDDGRIKHNGTRPGLLYYVSEEIRAGDVVPHPRTVMKHGMEWLNERELRVVLIGPVEITEDEVLTAEEVAELGQRMRHGNPPQEHTKRNA